MSHVAVRDYVERRLAEVKQGNETRADWDWSHNGVYQVPGVAIQELLDCIKDLMVASGKTWAELTVEFPQHVVAMDAAEKVR